MEIKHIFPTVIAIADLSDAITKEHCQHLTEVEYYNNAGNYTSKDTYILNWPVFSDLKTAIEDKINKHFVDQYSPIDGVKIKITQSWVNMTEENQFHHKHMHSNSAFSAVLYLKVDEEDVIMFHKQPRSDIKFKTKEWNLANAESWRFPVKANHLIIFPSWLEHSVPIKKTTGQRMSMAINTFYEGKLGDDYNLTALNIHI